MWSQGHGRIFGVVIGSQKFFSTVVWGHGAVPCRAESNNFVHTSNGAASACSSAMHALSESILY